MDVLWFHFIFTQRAYIYSPFTKTYSWFGATNENRIAICVHSSCGCALLFHTVLAAAKLI